VIHTENPGHEADDQELGPGQCHHYVHKPNPVYQIGTIDGEHNPGKLRGRIPGHLRYSPMDAPVVDVLKTRKGEFDSKWCDYREKEVMIRGRSWNLAAEGSTMILQQNKKRQESGKKMSR